MRLPFFKRPTEVEDVVATSVQSKPSISVVAGRDVRRPVTTYTDVSQVPEYRELLTGQGGGYTVKESYHQCVAALCQKSAALLLASEDFRSTNEYFSLRQRLANAYPSVKEAVATPSVLLSLYSKNRTGGKRAERKEDDEALSINLFTRISLLAIAQRCTDIHVVVLETAPGAVVLYRIDGIVRRSESIPQDLAVSAIGVAFNKMAEKGSRSEGAFNQGIDQSAMIPISAPDGQYKLRFQTIKLSGGFKVIMRILQTSSSKDAEAKPLDVLGYSPDQCSALYAAAKKRTGLTVVTGPTGSGKSTTLKTLMTHSPTRLQRIQYSIEDPVEYKMFGIHQISLQRGAKEDDTTAIVAALRSVLRGDPDEVMVGEVRDREMGSLLARAVLSGHQCMTTVHANSALDIPERLSDDGIGIRRDVFASRNFLSALVYQRLMPLLCTCKKPAHEATEKMFPTALRNVLRDKFQLDPATMHVTNPEGCPKCGHTGTYGQTVIAEVVRPDMVMRKMFRERRDDEAEVYWRETRTAAFDEPDCTGKTALEHGLYKVSLGLIDPVTLDEMTEPLDHYQVYPIKGN